MTHEPLYLINSAAPTRICDNGGWTDTWFAQHGTVLNIAIEPRVQAQIRVYPRQAMEEQVSITAQNYGETYAREPGTPWQKHPLIEASIDHLGVPDKFSIAVHLYSEAPPGASLGTSATLTVALLGALDCLTDGRLSPHAIAYQAQQVETVRLGWQCGVQDQLAAAFGGICYIEMHQYPHARVTRIRPDEKILWELQSRLLVVCMDKPRHSSQVHEQVIAHLEDAGPDEPRLEVLRQTAAPARDALLAGDFAALGQTFIANTEGQRALHPSLINPVAQHIIDLAKKHETLGWKVNGAGGEGGSVTLLLDGSAQGRHRLMDDLSKIEDVHLFSPRLARQGLRRYIIDQV